MKRIIFLIVFVCMAFASNAQTNTLYFMEDVPKNTSWNPAFMPRYSGYISLFDIYGEVGNNAMMLRDFVFKRNGRWTTAFSPSESIDELYRRIGGNINGDVRFGLSVLNFGFRIKEKNFFTFDASLRGEAYSISLACFYMVQDAKAISTSQTQVSKLSYTANSVSVLSAR